MRQDSVVGKRQSQNLRQIAAAVALFGTKPIIRTAELLSTFSSLRRTKEEDYWRGLRQHPSHEVFADPRSKMVANTLRWATRDTHPQLRITKCSTPKSDIERQDPKRGVPDPNLDHFWRQTGRQKKGSHQQIPGELRQMSVVVNPLLFYGIRQNISISRRRTTKMYRGSRNPQSTKPAIRQAERKQQIDHATTTSVAEISTVGYQPARSANCTDLGRKRSEYSGSESHSHNGMLEHTDHCTIKRAATALPRTTRDSRRWASLPE